MPQKPDSTPDRSKDELQRLLQEALKQKRPRRLRLALAATLVVAGLLLLVAWLFTVKDEPPRLTVVAFDNLDVAGGKVTLEGRLEAPVDARITLAGKDMVFVDGQDLLDPGQRVRTGTRGEAACVRAFPREVEQGSFILRLIGDKFQPGMEDRGRVFLRPSATPLCLVQIDDTLTLQKDQAWRTANSQELAPAPAAGAALRQARASGYEIVYLATAADRPTLYQKMRGWLEYQSAPGSELLPVGAVLSRFTLPGGDQNHRLWQKTAELLASRFVLPKGGDPAKHLAIAGTIDAAQQFHAAGLRTLYLGAGDDVPAAVERLAGWEEIERLLEK